MDATGFAGRAAECGGAENRNLYLFARLKTGISAKQARADIATLGRLAAEAFPDTEKGWVAETAPAVTLVCEVFARRYFPNGDAIGKQVLIDSGDAKSAQCRQIVGIVRSVKINPLDSVTHAEIYEPFCNSLHLRWP